MSGDERLLIDLSAVLVADSGMRVGVDEGSGYITARLWTNVSAYGTRFAYFSLTNVTDRPVMAIPCFAAAGDLWSIGHHRIWCDPGGSSTFRFRVPDSPRIDRIGVYAERSSLQCLFVLPLTPPAPVIGPAAVLGALCCGIAVGIASGLAWRSKSDRPEPAAQSEPEPASPPTAPAPEEPPPPPAPPDQPEHPSPAAEPAIRDESTVRRNGPPDRAYSVARSKSRNVRLADAVMEEPRSRVAFAGDGGRVVASLEMLARQFTSASYVVKVVNDSPEPLICSALGSDGKQHSELKPSAFRVEPNAASAVMLSVPLRLWSPFRQVLVTMRSRTLSSSLHAPVPQSPLVRPVAAVVVLILLLAGLAIAYSQLRPQITAYALPGFALAGSQIRAGYATSGLGHTTYEVTQGRRIIASGSLDSGTGFFEFPSASQAARYRVALRITGPFGSQSQGRVLQTVQQRRGYSFAPPLISAFEVDDAAVASGSPIVARYVENGTGGTLRLIDAAQIPTAQIAISRIGISAIAAPKVAQPTPYRLELRVRGQGSTQEASIGIVVLPRVVTRRTAPPAPNLLTRNQLLKIEPAYVRGNGEVRVRLLAHPTHLRLVLQDSQGVPLASRIARPGQRLVIFTLPPVGVDQTFIIIANFQQGSGDQVVLAPFTVHAR